MENDEIKFIADQNIKSSKKSIKTNLIILILFIILFTALQIFRGKVNLENFFNDNNTLNSYNNKSFSEKLNERLNNLKEYLIFLSILSIGFLIIHKMNLNWEREFIKKNPDALKKLTGLETIIEENETENDDKEKEKDD